jgi:predicted MFS family arabinose efflux permease
MSNEVTARNLLRDRSVASVLFCTFAGATAAIAQAVALGKLVYDITGSKADLGLLGLAEFLPTAILVLVAGSVADRFDRRRVAAAGLTVEILSSLYLAWFATHHGQRIWPVFVAVIFFGIARSFATPATRALTPAVAPEGTMPRVAALGSVMWQSATITGPVLAGVLFLVGPEWPFIAAALLLAIAAVAISFVHPIHGVEATAERPTLSHALEGLKFVRRTPLLLAAIALDLFAVLFGGAVALLPVLAKDRLHVNAVGLGWLRAAGGIGAAATAIYLAARPFNSRVGKRLLIAVGVFGVATIVLGLTTSFVVAMLMMGVLMAADMVSVFVRSTVVPLATPALMRGRVLALEAVFIGASNELGAFESGVTAQALGTVVAIVLGGAATLVIVLVWWARFPQLRDLNSFDELQPTEDAAS